MPGGQFAVAADVDLARKGGHKLRLWVVDAAGRPVRSLTWGGGGDDWPRALATTPQGRIVVAGQSTSRGGTKAWLVAFDGATAAFDQALAGSEANAVLAISNDVQIITGSREGRAWLARVQSGQVTAECLWGEQGCSATSLAPLGNTGYAVALTCKDGASLGIGPLPGPMGKRIKLASKGPCKVHALGKSLLLACADEASAVDPKSGKLLWTRRFPQAWQLPYGASSKAGVVLLGVDANQHPMAWQLDGKGKPTPRPLPALTDEAAPVGGLIGTDWVTLSPLNGDLVWRRVVLR
jgi:hypothetical protein